MNGGGSRKIFNRPGLSQQAVAVLRQACLRLKTARRRACRRYQSDCGAQLPLSHRQVALGCHQVGQPQQKRQVACSWPGRDSAGIAEAPLHLQERMLHLCSDRRLTLLGQRLLAFRRQLPPSPRPQRHMPLYIQRPHLRPLGHALIASVAPHLLLASVQQARRHGHVMHVRRCVATLCTIPVSASAPICSFIKMPLIPLLRLMHLRVASPRTILRRRRRLMMLASMIVPSRNRTATPDDD